jgi:activating signal cointegrator 1
MKLISLWDPWATLMASGHKRIETRSWITSYRGWLAIHAAKVGLSKRDMGDYLRNPRFAAALDGQEFYPGCIVALVRLLDCLPMEDRGCIPGVFSDYPELDTPQEREFGDFHSGRWAWVTENRFRLPKPIPFRASQGLMSISEDVETAIQMQMLGPVISELELLVKEANALDREWSTHPKA